MKVKAKTKRPESIGLYDLNSSAALADFKEAVKESDAKATRSKEAALKTLVDAGIYTKSGRLSKNYR